MNEEIRAYASTYISPVKTFHLTLTDALKEWGEDFNKEDFTYE